MLLPAVTLVAVAAALWGWGAYLVERREAARERATAERYRSELRRADDRYADEVLRTRTLGVEIDGLRAEVDDLRLHLGYAEGAQADAVRQFQQLHRWRVLLTAICRRTGIALPEDIAPTDDFDTEAGETQVSSITASGETQVSSISLPPDP